MIGYSYFAEFYDKLTKNVCYKELADYIISIGSKYKHEFGLTLDLACGTGELTIELAKRGIDILGVDLSIDMLSKAQYKAQLNDLNILFLCQDMRKLDLFGTVDTVICSLDSINHLIKESDIQDCFNRVSLFLNPGGYFIFDVNTLYKHRNILANNTFVYDVDDVYCVWQNQLLEDTNCVQINLDFFEKQEKSPLYSRSSEEFLERAYSSKRIEEIINASGMEVVDCFDNFTFNEPQETSQRLVYIVKK